MRHVVAAEEEPRVGESGGGMLNLKISLDKAMKMVGIQRDVLRAAGAMKKGTGGRAEEEGENGVISSRRKVKR